MCDALTNVVSASLSLSLASCTSLEIRSGSGARAAREGSAGVEEERLMRLDVEGVVAGPEARGSRVCGVVRFRERVDIIRWVKSGSSKC